MHGLEYDDSTGKLYGGSNGNLFEINKMTGFATQIGSTGLTSFLNLGYHRGTDTMYATNSNTDSLYTINRATGVATLVGPLVNSTNPNGLAYNPDNGLMYMIDNSTDNFYSLNLATGEANLIGFMGSGNLLGLAYISEIPEPASLAGLSMASLLVLRRRT